MKKALQLMIVIQGVILRFYSALICTGLSAFLAFFCTQGKQQSLCLWSCPLPVRCTPFQIVLQLLDGSIPLAPDIELDLVDVRDVATAHVEALERPEAKGRYLMVAKNVTILEVRCNIV